MSLFISMEVAIVPRNTKKNLRISSGQQYLEENLSETIRASRSRLKEEVVKQKRDLEINRRKGHMVKMKLPRGAMLMI